MVFFFQGDNHFGGLSNCNPEADEFFSSIGFKHVPQDHNKYVDALASLAPKLMFLTRQ